MACVSGVGGRGMGGGILRCLRSKCSMSLTCYAAIQGRGGVGSAALQGRGGVGSAAIQGRGRGRGGSTAILGRGEGEGALPTR